MLIGPGCLVLIVGPSGVGKDSVISQTRASLGQKSDIHFPTRVVTRAPDATEATQFVSPADFDHMEAAGALALSWRAHGLAYGLPISINAEVERGCVVVANVSRTVVPLARKRYARCSVVQITADIATRAQRLMRRGRETSEQLADRFAREELCADALKVDLTIENEGTLEQAAGRLLLHLTQLGDGQQRPAEKPIGLCC